MTDYDYLGAANETKVERYLRLDSALWLILPAAFALLVFIGLLKLSGFFGSNDGREENEATRVAWFFFGAAVVPDPLAIFFGIMAFYSRQRAIRLARRFVKSTLIYILAVSTIGAILLFELCFGLLGPFGILMDLLWLLLMVGVATPWVYIHECEMGLDRPT